MLVQYILVFIPVCSPNAYNGVVNPITIFQSKCAEALHFSALHLNGAIAQYNRVGISHLILKAMKCLSK